jgi:fibronectin-binding autotransporter adhesin
MKIRILLTAIASTLISSAALHASYFWTNATSNGLWDYTSNNWNSDSPSTTGTTYTSGNVAFFPSWTTPGTVTIASGGVTSGPIGFQANGYNITGGTLYLAGGQGDVNIDVPLGITATISSYIDGTGVSGKAVTSGAGTLNLAGGGNFGTFEVDNISTLGFQAGTFNFANLRLINGYQSSGGVFGFTLGTTLNATTLTLNGTSLDLAGTTGLTASAYVIATYGSLAGTFTSANTPVGYTLDYAYNGNEIALVQSVPEPSTWAMLLGGLGMLTMFRRRRA